MFNYLLVIASLQSQIKINLAQSIGKYFNNFLNFYSLIYFTYCIQLSAFKIKYKIYIINNSRKAKGKDLKYLKIFSFQNIPYIILVEICFLIKNLKWKFKSEKNKYETCNKNGQKTNDQVLINFKQYVIKANQKQFSKQSCKAEWRNGSAADFQSEGCGFESHLGCHFYFFNLNKKKKCNECTVINIRGNQQKLIVKQLCIVIIRFFIHINLNLANFKINIVSQFAVQNFNINIQNK
ncbi:transmembrane protein, putative (macronuclear) [Tetrahymena thermophila SB210]|uniref:Transmembrane protein, putative n=1 Tax=Tetrahymena thermophila (strain SB210) TaxID=312017 RepID=W7XKJ2_TETTS|nr:transmembrane protein, putative [Tetrahymena thermophila SB210]EWS76576.1 transmembrane protein, putative [Tetrahymena thermophila SB210]|eukprot:XP_012650862.1 transmembrane protein, putative [Tetrahymena thermophila SB210]